MLYSITNTDDWEDLNQLASLQNQVIDLRLQDNLGKQNFHDEVKNVFQPVTKTSNETAIAITESIRDTKKNN